MPHRRLLPWVAVVICLAAAAGCGKKGPLYLPDDGAARPAPVQQHP